MPPQSFAAVGRRPSPPSLSPYDAPPDLRQRPPHICVMPAVGATAPFDLEAKARAEQGFSRRLEQPRHVTPPPPVSVAAAAILCGIASYSSRDFTCEGGDRCLSLLDLQMEFAPRALPSDWRSHVSGFPAPDGEQSRRRFGRFSTTAAARGGRDISRAISTCRN